jgi:hypothetical protein
VGVIFTYGSQTSDINTGEVGRDFRDWFVDITKPIKPRIWNGDTSFFRVYCGVGEVGSLPEIWRVHVSGKSTGSEVKKCTYRFLITH